LHNNSTRPKSLPRLVSLLLLGLVLLAFPLRAQGSQERVIRLGGRGIPSGGPDVLPRGPLSRPTVGIALSGGGARGLAHIGVLKVIEKEGIPVDVVAGSSMGSIIGGLFAAGYSAEEIEEIALNVDWDTIFEDRPKRSTLLLAEKEARSRQLVRVPLEQFNIRLPSAFSTGQRMCDLLSNLTLRANFLADADFDRLPRRFRCVATDLLSGKSVVIQQGDLAEAMRASAGLPLFLTPVERKGGQLVDGGILNNIPVDVVRDMGADIVVAVNVTSSLRPAHKLKAVWEIADQMVTIMMQDARDKQLEDADLIITPELSGYSSRGFKSTPELIQAGEIATQQKLADLRALMAARSPESQAGPVLLSAVAIQGNVSLSESFVRRLVALEPGQLVTEDQIRQAVRALYDSGYCWDVWATIREGADRLDVTFHVKENPILTGIEVEGNTLFTKDEILSTMQSVPGLILKRQTLEQDVIAVTHLYLAKGKTLAQVHPLPFDSTTGLVRIDVDEGRIGRIRVEGNRRTRTSVILREFPLREDQTFDQEQAEQGISNVYATGLFDTAVMTARKGNPGAEVVIKVKEKSFVAGELGVHFDKAHGSEAFLGLLHDNALGLGIKLLLSGRVGEKRRLYVLEERANRLWRTYLTCVMKAYLSGEKRNVYVDHNRIGEYRDARSTVRLAFGQQMYRWGAATAELRVENARFERLSGRGFPEGSMRIRSLVLRSILDSLDRFPFPRSGRRHHLYVESAGKVLGGTESYVKLLASLDSFYTLRRKHTFRWGLAWGTADRSLPLAQAFRLGGGDNLYGYDQGQPFGDRNNLFGYSQDEFLGRQLVAGGVEYIFWIPRYFYLSLICQAGNVWKATDKIRLSELRYGWGIRGAFDTPAGPVSLGFGRAGEGCERLYFSAGYEF